ncbi:hypothetical protein [Ignatzschineria sp. LJL83]
MKLLQILDLIKQRQSIDWPHLHQSLLHLGITEALIRETFNVKRYSEKIYAVTIINHDFFENIMQLIEPSDKSSRATASMTGNSHIAAVNGALLIANTHHRKSPYVHLIKSGFPIPEPQKNNAIIIENLECFINFQDTYQFMKQFCEFTAPIDDIEFIYAAGNSISNQIITPYLHKFSGHIYCLLDIDIGGLQIYKNLLNNGLSLSTTHFVIPKDIHHRLQRSRRNMNKTELAKLNSFLNISSAINQLITYLHHYQTSIEQESYRVL